MEEKNWKNIIKEHILILLLFAVLTLILTYPVINRLTTSVAGGGTNDSWGYQWNIWHVSEVLKEGGGIAELYHSDLLLYPHGASLEWAALTLTNTLFLAFPLTLITDNLILIYNILFLFNFIVAGYAMYLLVKYLVKDRTIAFLVGFAYTFSPLHMIWGYLDFLHLISFPWTPLFFLFFFKMFQEQKMRNAVLAAIFLFFLALAAWEHLLFALLIAVPYFAYKLITNPHLFIKHFFIRLTLFLTLFTIIISPFIFPMLSAYFRGEVSLYGLYSIKSFSFVPPILTRIFLHPLWGGSLNKLVVFLGSTSEQATIIIRLFVLGCLVIFISFSYLIKARKHLFWFLLAAFFFFFPQELQGIVASFWSRIPLANMLGGSNVQKFFFISLFSFLIFFAFALDYFLPKWRQRLGKRAITGILFIFLVVEYLAVPYPTTGERDFVRMVVESAKEIGETLKGPHPVFGDHFSILSLPPSYNLDHSGGYFQMFHKKPIIGGNVSRPKIAEMQTFKELYKIFYENDVDKFRSFLKNNNVGYIVFYQLGDYKSSLFLLEQIPHRLIFKATDDISSEGIYAYEVLLGKTHRE